MRVSEILAHIKEKYGIVVTPVTVSNWQKRGRGGSRLPPTPTAADIKAFFRAVGTSFGRGRPAIVK
jgi:hypothetical protein